MWDLFGKSSAMAMVLSRALRPTLIAQTVLSLMDNFDHIAKQLFGVTTRNGGRELPLKIKCDDLGTEADQSGVNCRQQDLSTNLTAA